ncbi:MAG TPA: DUF4294 domain-containing protein [Flavobacteriaceae bacterium]|nr:DUF4294 domain-containing protein [Flavobacteriaceae bacterium]
MSRLTICFILMWSMLSVLISYGQERRDTLYKKDSTYVDGYIVGKVKDTLEIELDEVWLLPKINFESKQARREYLKTKRRVYKVYPFAVLAAERLEVVNDLLETLPNNRSRRVYLRRAEKFMQEEFTDTLKTFTRSEGRILFKLVHRQTGYTTFELVKEYRSGWKAFWFNTAASVYDLSMKQTYEPYTEKEDFYIEDILQNAFRIGRLEEQDPAVIIDLLEMYNSWQEKEETPHPE